MEKRAHIYELRVLYELRKTRAQSPRHAVARVFYRGGFPGLVDATGILWPVVFMPGIRHPGQGDMVLLQAVSRRSDGGIASKYEDDGYFVVVNHIVEAVHSLGPWTNAVLPSPIPGEEEFAENLETSFTHYLASAVQRRFERLALRQDVLTRTREFFENRGFLLVETPTLVPSGGVEPYLGTFETSYRDVRGVTWRLSLPTSPEFALKKLLVESPRRIFQISRAYRNGGELARWHEPEFLMLEWYRPGASLHDIMADTRDLVTTLAALGRADLNLPSEWPVFTVEELFRLHCGFSLTDVQEEASFRRLGATVSHSVVESDDWDAVFCKVFMERIEPFLAAQKACFVREYPRQMGALARVSTSPLFVERFECYLMGVEICNGYHELTDAIDLAERFSKIEAERKDAVRRDPLFEEAMKFGLPPCSGNALGIDRVCAILNGCDRIAELFPLPFLSQFPCKTVAAE